MRSIVRRLSSWPRKLSGERSRVIPAGSTGHSYPGYSRHHVYDLALMFFLMNKIQFMTFFCLLSEFVWSI